MSMDDIIKLRHILHENAELSGCEVKTKEILMRFIKEHTQLELVDMGYWFYVRRLGTSGHKTSTQLELVDMGYWFYVRRLGTSGHKIALRADFDAVASPEEGAKHMCGHDGHSAILAAVACKLDKAEKEEVQDTVYLIFQHGEENGTGGAECARFVKEEGIDEVYGLHNIPEFPINTVLVKNDTFACASVGMTIHLTGKPSHAAYPEAGINPGAATGAILSKAEIVKTESGYQGMVLCTPICVRMGEPAFGVSASESEIMFTIRAHYEKDLDILRERLECFAKEQAEACGLNIEFSYQDAFPDTVNNAECVERIRRAAKDAELPLLELSEPFRWSEDFGHYLKENKGAFFGIGDGEEHPQLHTAAYEFPDAIISTAVKMFYQLLKVQK